MAGWIKWCREQWRWARQRREYRREARRQSRSHGVERWR